MRILFALLLLSSAPVAAQTDWGRYAEMQRLTLPPMPGTVWTQHPVTQPVLRPAPVFRLPPQVPVFHAPPKPTMPVFKLPPSPGKNG